HILLISDNFIPESNVPAIRGYEHALAWVKQGHKVSVLTCFPNFPKGKIFPGYKQRLHQHEDMDGIEVHRVASIMFPNRGVLLRLLDFISFAIMAALFAPRIKQVDAVVATSPQPFAALAGWAVAKCRRKPLVLEIRDLWPQSVTALGVMKENIMT